MDVQRSRFIITSIYKVKYLNTIYYESDSHHYCEIKRLFQSPKIYENSLFLTKTIWPSAKARVVLMINTTCFIDKNTKGGIAAN